MQLGEGCFERVFGRRGAMGKAGPDACSLQREFFMGSEGRWERQGLARVRYSVSSLWAQSGDGKGRAWRVFVTE